MIDLSHLQLKIISNTSSHFPLPDAFSDFYATLTFVKCFRFITTLCFKVKYIIIRLIITLMQKNFV